MKKSIYCKMIVGSLGGGNIIGSVRYDYDEQTFEYLGCSTKCDGGKEAELEGYYNFDSVKSFVETKGETKLIKIEDNNKLS